MPPQQAVLAKILTYGPSASAATPPGQLLLVVPRPGTISPWSTKATDIARNCGLSAVHRIERGIAYYIQKTDGAALTDTETQQLSALIHDRMIETVLVNFEEAEDLFSHAKPAPLTTVDVLGGRRNALTIANRELGLALVRR